MKKLTALCVVCLVCILSFVLASCEGGSNEEMTTTTAHTHSYGDWNITKAPTCTQKGEKVRYCSCGKEEIETINKSTHDWNEGVCKKCSATCSHTTKQGYCGTCGKYIDKLRFECGLNDALNRLSSLHVDVTFRIYWADGKLDIDKCNEIAQAFVDVHNIIDKYSSEFAEFKKDFDYICEKWDDFAFKANVASSETLRVSIWLAYYDAWGDWWNDKYIFSPIFKPNS